MSGETLVITRKLQLYPVGDKDEVNRVYGFIRNGQYAQYQGLNLLMGQLASKYYACNRNVEDEEFVAFRKEILKNNNILLDGIDFAVGVDTKSAITQKVSQDFSSSLKNGLARGDRSITNYKRTIPLITRSRNLIFKHDYPTYADFLDAFNQRNLEVYINWVNKIRFKVVFGNPKKSHELRCVIKNIFEEVYKVMGSSIEINNNKIVLNLSLQIPKKRTILDDTTVVGVSLGIHTPAICALNKDSSIVANIGYAQDFIRMRTKIQAQRRSLQSHLKYTNSGGHGRSKKLKPLERFKEYESNFAQTYNHMVSRNIVEFALKNQAKYINILDLDYLQSLASKGKKDNKATEQEIILKNWSYYQLNQYITYKAAMHGIEVRIVHPKDFKDDLDNSNLTDQERAYIISTSTDYSVKKKKKKKEKDKVEE